MTSWSPAFASVRRARSPNCIDATTARQLTSPAAQIRQWIASTSRFHALNTRRAGLRRTAAEESDPLRRAAIEPEQWVALEAKLSAINRVLAAVSPLDRAAFERCVVDGLLYKQAASVLGISHPAVRNRLGRVRRELAAEISRED